MKKLLCVLLSLVLLAGSAAFAQELTPADKLLNDWGSYLYNCEHLYANTDWAVQYADAYAKEPSWENLQKARAAVCMALVYAAAYELPEADASAEDQDALLDRGLDVSFVQVSLDEYQQEKQKLQNTLLNLQGTLEGENAFWQYTLESLGMKTANMLEYSRHIRRYLAVTTNYLLQVLGEEADAEAYTAFVAQHCPTIAAHMAEFPGGTAELEAAAASVLDDAEACLLVEEELLGRSNAALMLYEEILASGDLSQLAEKAVAMADLPIPLPDPYWYDGLNADIQYYWRNAEGKAEICEEYAQLTVPDACLVRYTGITREALDLYLDYLNECGIAHSTPTEADGKYTVLYEIGDGTVMFQMENGVLKVYMAEGPVLFAPTWYILKQF